MLGLKNNLPYRQKPQHYEIDMSRLQEDSNGSIPPDQYALFG